MDVEDEGNLEVQAHIDDPHQENVKVARGQQEEVSQLALTGVCFVISALACVYFACLVYSGMEHYSTLVRANRTLTLELQRITIEKQRLERTIEQLTRNHSDKVKTLQMNNDQDIKTLKQNHTYQIESLKQNHTKEYNTLKENHTN